MEKYIMSNNWTSTKKFDEKKRATRLIVNYIPNLCNNGTIVLMPSTTCYDIEELYSQNKINEFTNFYAVDNLECAELKKNEYKNTKSVKERIFRNLFRERLKNIMGSNDLYFRNKNNLILGNNIQDVPMLSYTYEKTPEGCDVIYADTCGIYSQQMINWIVEKPTLQSLKDNGIFAVTILLTRKKIEGDFSIPLSNPDLLFLGKNKEINSKKMFAIANDIENISNNVLQSKALIYYEDNINSPMGVFIFQKKNKDVYEPGK